MNNFTIIKLSKTNCYLFPVIEGYLLLDCGYDKDKKLLDKRLSALNINYSDIQYLFLTHHHDDHSGLTNYIVAQNPDVTVIMHHLCKDLIKTGMNERSENGGWCSRGAKFVAEFYHKFHPEWTLSFPPYAIRDNDYLIKDSGDTFLQHIGLRAKIIFTPGHTPDSISILDDKGNLFCGDGAANFLKWAGTKYSPFYITDLNEYYKSWDKIIISGATIIYPAHGNKFSINKLIIHKNTIKQLSEFKWN